MDETQQSWDDMVDVFLSWFQTSKGNTRPKITSRDVVERKLAKWLQEETRRRRLELSDEDDEVCHSTCATRKGSPSPSCSPMDPYPSQSQREWQKELENLMAWREKNPGQWPSPASADVEEQRLGTWMYLQRYVREAMKTHVKCGGKDDDMTIRRMQLLALKLPGWMGDRYDGIWFEKAALVVKWLQDHPQSWPRRSGGSKHETRLRRWLSEQRDLFKKVDGTTEARRDTILNRSAMLDVLCPGWRDI